MGEVRGLNTCEGVLVSSSRQTVCQKDDASVGTWNWVHVPLTDCPSRYFPDTAVFPPT